MFLGFGEGRVGEGEDRGNVQLYISSHIHVLQLITQAQKRLCPASQAELYTRVEN